MQQRRGAEAVADGGAAGAWPAHLLGLPQKQDEEEITLVILPEKLKKPGGIQWLSKEAIPTLRTNVSPRVHHVIAIVYRTPKDFDKYEDAAHPKGRVFTLVAPGLQPTEQAL